MTIPSFRRLFWRMLARRRGLLTPSSPVFCETCGACYVDRCDTCGVTGICDEHGYAYGVFYDGYAGACDADGIECRGCHLAREQREAEQHAAWLASEGIA